MISIEQIKNFYPSTINGNAAFLKYMLKEYLQLLVLDYLSTTKHVLHRGNESAVDEGH